MSVQPYQDVPAPFRRLAESMWGQEQVGIGGSLLMRLFRFLSGDPSAPIVVTSPNNTTPVSLPDNTPAFSAVFTVSGNPIRYTMDGTNPNNANAAIIPIGSIVTLTGQPSIKGFQFVSTALGGSSISGYYYT